jgi:MinD-like ATPase involved in chromosome partitioning or flagellar assembly
VVLLVPDPADERWRTRKATILALDTAADAIRQALLSTRRGERGPRRPRSSPEPVRLKPADTAESRRAGVIAVAGGAGSPGRTTVAINLAAALGSAGPTVLVEADVSAPAVAAFLDRDPSRNICTLAHAIREAPHAWDAALADELQPLSRVSPAAVVLCGPPKREMRASIAPAFVERLVAELASRYTYVVLDVGSELLGMEHAAANHRAALGRAHQLLLVTGSDLVGLWHARTALDQLERHVGVDRQTLNLVLNCHDARFHHPSAEVEWHLGARVAAVIPFDHAGAQRAMTEQRPLIAEPATRAARSLLKLAEQVHAAKLRLPTPAAGAPRASWWQRVLQHQRHGSVARTTLEPERWRVASPPERRSRAW